MTEYVNQHYVPRFLLNRFAKNGQLRAHDLKAGTSRLIPTLRAAAEDDFYSGFDSNGRRDTTYEHILSDLEAHAAPAVRRLVEDNLGGVTSADRATFAELMALQIARTRRVHDQLEALYRSDALHNGDEEAAAGPLPDGFHLQVMDDVVPELFGLLVEERGFGWVRFGPENPLLTSDHPAVTPTWSGKEGEWIGAFNAEDLWLPIDRYVAIAFRSSDVRDAEAQPTADLANTINEIVAHAAYKWIYHHPDDDPMSRLRVVPRGDRMMLPDEIYGPDWPPA